MAEQDRPVAEVRDWLTRQGVAVPEPEPLLAASVPSLHDPVPAGRVNGSSDGPRRRRRSGSRRAAEGAGRDAEAGGDPGADRDAEVDPDPVGTARTIALRKLAAQARTRHELAEALRAKDVPKDAAATVLDRMEEVGLVDDATFAVDWVSSRQQRRHLSRSMLRRELQTKGVDGDQIDEALSSVGTEDEYVAALTLAERRYRNMSGLPREVAFRRLSGALGRRGFSGATAARVLGEVLGRSGS